MPDAWLDPGRIEHNILHEIGHTMITLPFERVAPTDKSKMAGYMVRKAIGMPEAVSHYAHQGPRSEATADEFATALDVVTGNGLAHPDEWRKFTSGANRKALAVVTQIEASMPGFTDYLAAQKLAGRSAYRVPLVPFAGS